MSKKLSDLKVGDEVALSRRYAINIQIAKIVAITPKGFIRIDIFDGMIDPSDGYMRGCNAVRITTLTKKLRSEIFKRERLSFLKREMDRFANSRFDLEKGEAIYKIIKGESNERNN